MSQLKFELYGILEQLAGTAEYTLEFEAPTQLDDALTMFSMDKPDIKQHLERCACAIGDSLVHRQTMITQDTLVALLPPVAGG
ncbi:MoaD/ThiS family protein [Acinetobacter puyangensis]|uniref:MoaD/ThiS family protein n=1 Tax=Acinetobacter puyangensis TaxID=1096779 RepID=UPI003A4DA22C